MAERFRRRGQLALVEEDRVAEVIVVKDVEYGRLVDVQRMRGAVGVVARPVERMLPQVLSEPGKRAGRIGIGGRTTRRAAADERLDLHSPGRSRTKKGVVGKPIRRGDDRRVQEVPLARVLGR